MSRSQQKRPLDLKQSQNLSHPAGGKTIGPHTSSSGTKGKRAHSNRAFPVSRVQEASGNSQSSPKANDPSPWRKPQSNAVRVSSTCSSPTRHLPAAIATSCTFPHINGCVCGRYAITPSPCERSGRNAINKQIRFAKDMNHSEFSSPQRTASNDTTKPRFYCCKLGCFVSCSRESDLARHRRSKHSDSTFECSYPGCDYQRSRRDKLLKHTREAHSSRLIACPAIEYNFSLAVGEKATRQLLSRDQMNASKHDRLNLSQTNIRTSGWGENGEVALAATRYKLLDAEMVALDQSKATVSAGVEVDAAAHAGSTEAPASHHSSPTSRHFAKRRSRSVPKSTMSELRPSITQQASIRTAIGIFESGAEKTSGEPLVRPVSTPPTFSSFPSEHLTSSIKTHPNASTRGHTIQSQARSSGPRSSYGLESSPRDGDNGSSAPSQHHRTSWADVVRNASNTTTSSATVHLNDPGNKKDEANARIKGKRRKLNDEGHEELFVCIGHHHGRSDLDTTTECETTLKEYFSQLERHHDRHEWFYCARCLLTFPNANARKAHRNGQRCYMKCVTTTCPRYRTFPPFRCSHSGKDSDSGEAVWTELFRTYRPGEHVPRPKVRRTPLSGESSRPAEPSRLEIISNPAPVSPRGVVSPSSAGDHTPSATTNVTGGIGTFSPSGIRSRMLLTLAENLWRLIHRENVVLTPWIIQDYEVAMGSSMRLAQAQEGDHAATTLELFVERLWFWARADIERSPEQYAQLLTYAQYWLQSALVMNIFESSVSDLNNIVAPNGLTSLDGVGLQFQANSHQGQAPPVPAILPHQQYFTATHRGGSIQDQPYDPPWSGLVRPNQDGRQMQQHGIQPLRAPSDFIPPSNSQLEGVSQSNGTPNSGMLSSFNHMSRPDTNTRNVSSSTNPTSNIALNIIQDGDGLSNRLGFSEPSHRSSFHGSITSSCFKLSHDGEVDLFDLNDVGQR